MEITVTVQEMMALAPLRQSVLLAGAQGKSNILDNVQLASVLEEQKLTSNGLVIIKRGVGQEEEGETFLERLCEIPVAAIFIIGEQVKLPEQLAEIADSRKIPILLVSPLIQPEDIMFAFELANMLKRCGRFQQFIQNFTFQELNAPTSASLSELLRDIATHLMNPVALLNSTCQVLDVIAEPYIAADEIYRLVQNLPFHKREYSRAGSHSEPETGMISISSATLQSVEYQAVSLYSSGIFYGYLVVFGITRNAQEMDSYHLQRAAILVLRELTSQRLIQDIEGKYKSQFVYDLLYNNFDCIDTFAERGKLWGWDLGGQQQLLIVAADCYGRQDKVLLLARILAVTERIVCESFTKAIVQEQSGQIVVIAPVGKEMAGNRKESVIARAEAWYRRIRQELPDYHLAIGIARICPTAAELYRSYQEAKQALELGRFIKDAAHVTHFDDLGVIRLLANVSYELLDDFYREYLQPVMDYDEKNGTNFLDTLYAYFQENGDLNLVAEKLYMHANTLRYRLKKIEEILGKDLQKFDCRLTLYVACMIAKMRITG